MTYTNTPIVVSQQTTGYTSGNIPYSSIVLITGIPHAAQLEVERIFTQDRDGSTGPLLAFLADPAVTTAQKKAVFTIPISRCTLDSITSNITAIDLPATGGTVYNYVITTPTPTTYTIKIPSLSQYGSSTVTVRRKTVSNEPFVNWQAGSRLTSKQLNLSTTQSLYLIQEALEKIGTSVTIETTQITAASLSDNSVTTSAIASNAVTTAKILDANVTTAKILDANVTTAKIADSAVTTGKIADGTIVNADINASAAIDGSKISPVFTSASTFSSTLGVTGAATIQGLTVGKGGGSISTNSAFGLSALASNTTGNDNNAFGYSALQTNTTGVQNNAFGLQALYSNTIGINNNAFGYAALNANTIGGSNCAFGHAALQYNTTGVQNNAFGHGALYSNTTGYYNNAFGYSALNLNTTGSQNNAFGNSALAANTTGTDNNAFGTNALYSNTIGSQHCAFGRNALNLNTTGNSNNAFGYTALAANTTGSENCAFGHEALSANTIGDNNTAFGNSALGANVTGSANTSVGLNSLLLCTGSNNTALGGAAGNAVTSGSNNTALGYNAQINSPTSSNQIQLGNGSISSLRCQVVLTVVSDERDKTNIVEIPVGLNLISKIRPVSFEWNQRDGNRIGRKEFGFTAQQLQNAQAEIGIEVPHLVGDENPEQLGVSASQLIPVLVKAIQELNAKFEAYVATHP